MVKIVIWFNFENELKSIKTSGIKVAVDKIKVSLWLSSFLNLRRVEIILRLRNLSNTCFLSDKNMSLDLIAHPINLAFIIFPYHDMICIRSILVCT